MFSLKSLLLATAVAAVFIVAFLNRSPIWASVIVTLTVLSLIAAAVSIYLFPAKLPFVVCAVIAGVGYGGIALIRPLGLWHSLTTSHLLFEWWLKLARDEYAVLLAAAGGPIYNEAALYWSLAGELPEAANVLSNKAITSFRSLQQIGHCAIALILAVIAGLVGSYVARRRDVHARPNHV